MQHFDLVTVRIADEKVFRERLALIIGFDDLAGRKPDLDETLMFGVHVSNTDGEMAITIAQRIGHFATPVDGEFQLEITLGIAEIDQREVFELGAFRNLKPESLFVKFHRTLFVQHPDHRVDQLGHGVFLLLPVDGPVMLRASRPKGIRIERHAFNPKGGLRQDLAARSRQM